MQRYFISAPKEPGWGINGESWRDVAKFGLDFLVSLPGVHRAIANPGTWKKTFADEINEIPYKYGIRLDKYIGTPIGRGGNILALFPTKELIDEIET